MSIPPLRRTSLLHCTSCRSAFARRGAAVGIVVAALFAGCFSSTPGSGPSSTDAGAASNAGKSAGTSGSFAASSGASSTTADAAALPGQDGSPGPVSAADASTVSSSHDDAAAAPRNAGDASTSPSDAAPMTADAATLVITGAPADAAVVTLPTAYGENYWSWVPSFGDQVHKVQSGVAQMHLNVLRAGGHNNDNNSPTAFTNAEIDRFIAYARAIGAEPILQVPLLKDVDGGRPTAAVAANMVTYANKTKLYGIKYWEIGNEPDLYSDQGDLPAGYTAASYCADFSAFADAMRAVDSSIKILGPELSYKYVAGNDWLTPFLVACGSKVDVVSVHRYPFPPESCTIGNAMSDATDFRATLRRVRATLNSVGMSAVPLAITEANFTYDGVPTHQTQDAALGTFYAGMWVADATGVALEERLWSLAFWSLAEGYSLGFFTSDTFQPRPAAYAYELVTRHFGPTILQASTVPPGVAAHASRDDAAKKTIVLLLNHNAAASTVVLGFQNLPVMLPNRSVTLPGYSLTLLELPDDGGSPAIWSYTKAIADQNLPPQAQ